MSQTWEIGRVTVCKKQPGYFDEFLISAYLYRAGCMFIAGNQAAI